MIELENKSIIRSTDMEKITLQVEGMSCIHCEKAIKNALMDLGVKSVKASAKKNTVEVVFSTDKISLESIKAEIAEIGYKLNDGRKNPY